MPLSTTNDSKNSVTLTNDSKTGDAITWDEAIFTWDNSYPSTWDNARVPMTKDSKNNLSITNDSKN